MWQQNENAKVMIVKGNSITARAMAGKEVSLHGMWRLQAAEQNQPSSFLCLATLEFRNGATLCQQLFASHDLRQHLCKLTQSALTAAYTADS
jgi:hypothetical protein